MGTDNDDARELTNYLGRGTARWTAPDGRDWLVETTWAEVDGRAECVGLEVRSFRQRMPDGGSPLGPLEGVGNQPLVAIRSEVLRGGLAKLIDAARPTYARMSAGALDPDGIPENIRSDSQRLATWLAEHERRLELWTTGKGRKLVGKDGRPLSAHDALQEAARIYREAWSVGANPTQAVAESLSISRSAAAKRVARARDAGLLPRTKKGRADGGLAPPVAASGHAHDATEATSSEE